MTIDGSSTKTSFWFLLMATMSNFTKLFLYFDSRLVFYSKVIKAKFFLTYLSNSLLPSHSRNYGGFSFSHTRDVCEPGIHVCRGM